MTYLHVIISFLACFKYLETKLESEDKSQKAKTVRIK